MDLNINYTWIVEWMSTKKVDGDLQNVVVQAGWRVNAETTVDGKSYQTTSYGSAGFASPDPTSFTPYETLTKEQVLDWIFDAEVVDKESMEQGLKRQLESVIDPPVVQMPLPWVPTQPQPEQQSVPVQPQPESQSE
jgi:hypothetical protein